MGHPSNNEIIRFLEFIVAMKSEKSLDSYNVIKDVISKCEIPIPYITFGKGLILYRARIHSFNEDFYYKIDDISYRKDNSEIKKFGRANEPYQSIFYCSDNEYVAFFETTQLERKKENIDFEKMTIGVWQVQEDILVAHIPTNETIKGLNTALDGLQEGLNSLVTKFISQNTELYNNLLEFFSIEFTRDAKDDDLNYMISCAFSNYIYNIIGTDASSKNTIQTDGILYSSFRLNTEGFNFAIKPDVIDKGKIKLVDVFRRHIIKVEDSDYLDHEVFQAKRINYESGVIDCWEKVISKKR